MWHGNALACCLAYLQSDFARIYVISPCISFAFASLNSNHSYLIPVLNFY